ncbi:MAG TPA: class I SAM-dependent methyltransferase [Rhodanobacteraceae bacterium]|nr:class I SAM-dependent methyltransferase [Rhodanobacteraceae bacterium]
MSRLDALRGDFAVMQRMLRGMPRAASHAESLSAFYAPQARHYDRFRERLLRGRAELIERLPLADGARVVELGGGTGRNAEFFGATLSRIESLTIVDVCAPLLAEARERARRMPQLRVVEADATTYEPDEPVDVVYFSYALTMIPDWRAAIRNAIAMLKPGGVLGVVDFYVAQARVPDGFAQHGPLTRAFWPAWFRHDGVCVSSQHFPELRRLLPDHAFVEARARVPYLPLGRVPYYVFTGRKAAFPSPARGRG